MSSPDFSFSERNLFLDNLESEFFDLAIIGGGINGAGVAREAALRGMKVALIEKNDFASGTSSKSSKMIHGGIRYLENLEFHLVFEALSEREKLFQIAPHLVHPLRFMIPLYKNGRVGMFQMGLGMWLYDVLSLFQAPELHEKLDASESISRMPIIQQKDLLGSFIYSDAYMDDDRLTHETLRSAAANGAFCMNYVSAEEVEFNSERKISAINVLDRLTGSKKKIRAKHFVSTTGAWTDIFAEKVKKNWKKVLRPTKGVHITFKHERLPVTNAVVMGAEERIVFCIPRHDMVIVGTTDTDFKGQPEEVCASKEDIDYLLKVTDQYFPGSKLTKNDIVASYAGLRPLVQDESKSEGKTSREHTIFSLDEGITFIAGGKYTTYRLIAKQVVEKSLENFSIEDRVKFNLSKSDLPINPLITRESFSDKSDLVVKLKEMSSSLNVKECQFLIDRHGLEAIQMIEEYGKNLSLIEIETLQAIYKNSCLNITDFFTRRVPFSLADFDHGLSFLDEVAKVFQNVFEISDEELNLQKKLYRSYLEKEFAWKK